ncbi:hypothetical protein MICRO8M_70080 [Microbacterium sp. 8M]|nr:hypothetical protein MICRO8M_70080 [Microbacterium sp. 8M]
MVGVTGFEPAASSSRTKRATKLRHTPWQPFKSIRRGAWERIEAEPARGEAVESAGLGESGAQEAN